MKSFGIWYVRDNSAEMPREESKEYHTDLHINLWDIGTKNNREQIMTFIDLGLRVKYFKLIDVIIIVVPFSLNDGEIINLIDTFEKKNVANLVFNENCDIKKSSEGNVSCVIFSENPGEEVLLYDSELKDEKTDSGNTLIKFDLKTLREDDLFSKFDDLYIRFRIQSEKLKQELFCKVERKNWFLESGFNKTKIVDIKVNKKRNIDIKDMNQMRKNKFEFLEFDKIHFLVIVAANSEVEILGRDFFECRKLEPDWGEYLKIKQSLGNVLAYHWKVKSQDNCGKVEKIKEFGKMVKVNSATTTWKIIVVYIIVVISIGVITNTIFTYIVQPHIKKIPWEETAVINYEVEPAGIYSE